MLSEVPPNAPGLSLEDLQSNEGLTFLAICYDACFPNEDGPVDDATATARQATYPAASTTSPSKAVSFPNKTRFLQFVKSLLRHHERALARARETET
jgi:hypothetical protein